MTLVEPWIQLLASLVPLIIKWAMTLVQPWIHIQIPCLSGRINHQMHNALS